MNCGGCRTASPVFVAREILCRFGHVRVQVCRPWGRKVFPTSFWLVCPYLVRLAGKIESMGGVNGARFNQGCEELAKVEEITDPVSLVMYLEG